MPSTFTRSLEGGRRVVAVERGDVDDGVAALDGAREARAVEEVDALVVDILPTLRAAPVRRGRRRSRWRR